MGNDNFDLEKLILPVLYICEKTAIAASKWINKSQQMQADREAVNQMRFELNKLPVSGKIVIGEGERDKAPMLFIGEEVGKGGTEIDIAVDPLEGTRLCAEGKNDALSVMAIAKRGNLLNAPDVYMDKIAVGANLPHNIVDLDKPIVENLKNLAKAKNKKINDLRVIILNRSRHQDLIEETKKTGADVILIEDGDISAIIQTSFGDENIDMYIGIGGAPEGVLAAAALKAIGGQMQGRLLFNNDNEKFRAQSLGIKDLNKKYYLNDMVKGDVIFCLTGVTPGKLVKGIIQKNNHYITDSIITYSANNMIRHIRNLNC